MKPLSILVADDEAPIRFTLRRMLQREGFRVLDASDGLEMFRILEAQQAAGTPIDLVLMDIQMPGCSGIQALKRLGDSPFKPEVLFMTGSFDEADLPETGYPHHGVLTKPFAVDALLARLSFIAEAAPGRSSNAR